MQVNVAVVMDVTQNRVEEMTQMLRLENVDEIYLWTDDELHYWNNAPFTFCVKEALYISAAALLDCGAEPEAKHVKKLVANYTESKYNQAACLQLIGRCLRMLNVSSDDPEALTDELFKTLEQAMEIGSLPLARVMLKSYTNFITFINSWRLFEAVDKHIRPGTERSNCAIAELLLECNCDPNGANEDNGRPLFAVENDKIRTLLLENGADPNIQEFWHQQTPFHTLYAGEDSTGIPDIVKSFLEYGADPTIRDDAGNTPIYHFNEFSWYPELIELLQAREAARNLAVVMSKHPRLGAQSMLQRIPEDVFRTHILEKDAYAPQIAPPESSSEWDSDSE